MDGTQKANINVNLVASNEGLTVVKKHTDAAINEMTAQAENKINQANRVATAAIIGVGAITMEFFKAAMASAAFESSFAGIRKTVEATEEQFAQLADQIKTISTVSPVSTDELNRIGELGGQLGVAVQNLPSFIKTVSEISTTTNLEVENAALGLARLDAIAQTNGETFSNVASTIVELGNNFAATEGEIMTTVLRIAQAAAQVGATTQDALAFATALQAIGVPAQAGGTAVARVFQSINQAIIQGGESLDTFAAVAAASGNVTEEAFKQFFQDDPARATQAFIEGLNRLNESGQDVIGILDELGLSQRRTMLAILGLAEAEGVLENAINMANKAHDENTAATEEALKRYATLESQVQMTKNAFNELQIQIGDEITPTLKEVNILVQEVVLGFTKSEQAFNLLAGAGAILTTALLGAATQLKAVKAAASFLFGSKFKAGVTIVTGILTLLGLRSAQSAGEVERLNRAIEVFAGGGPITPASIKAMIGSSDEIQDAFKDAPTTAIFDPVQFENDLSKALSSGNLMYNDFLKGLTEDREFYQRVGQVTSFIAGKITEEGIVEGFDGAGISVQDYVDQILEGYDESDFDHDLFERFFSLSPEARAELINNRVEIQDFYNSMEKPVEDMIKTVQAYNRAEEEKIRLQAMEALGIEEVLFPAQETMIRQQMEVIKSTKGVGDQYQATLDDIMGAESIFDRIASNTVEAAESLFDSLDGIGDLAATSAEEINQNLAEKIQLAQIFEQQIAYLRSQGFDDVALEFSKLGPEYSGVLQNIIEDADALNLREVLLEKLGLSESEELKDGLFNSAGEIAEEIIPKTQEIGKNYIDGVIKGLEETNPELHATIEDVFQNAIDLAYQVTDSNSPSEKTKELGKFLMLGFVEGIVAEYPNVEQTWKGKTIDLVELIEDSVNQATAAMKNAFGSNFGLFDAQKSYLQGEEKLNELIEERTELLKGNTAQQQKNLQDAKDKADWASIAYKEGVITLAEYQLAQEELEEAENARSERLKQVNREIENQQIQQAQNLFSLGFDAFKLLQAGPEAMEMFKEIGTALGIDSDLIEKITGKTQELADTLGKKFGDQVDGVANKFFETNLAIEQEEITINVDNEDAITNVAQVQAQYDAFVQSTQDPVKIKVEADGSFNLGGQTGYAKGGRIPMYAKGGYLGSGLGIVGEAGPELIRAIPGGGVDITPIGNVGHTGIIVNNLNVNVTGVPSNPIQARKAAIEIRKALSRLDREGVVGTGIRGR